MVAAEGFLLAQPRHRLEGDFLRLRIRFQRLAVADKGFIFSNARFAQFLKIFVKDLIEAFYVLCVPALQASTPKDIDQKQMIERVMDRAEKGPAVRAIIGLGEFRDGLEYQIDRPGIEAPAPDLVLSDLSELPDA